MHFSSIIQFHGSSVFVKIPMCFCKGYSTQYCLSTLLKKWKSAIDKGKSFGALLTDLSKTFDCLSHELLLAELHACGFSIAALRLIHSYLTKRWQRTMVNMSCSSKEEIVIAVRVSSRTFFVSHFSL